MDGAREVDGAVGERGEMDHTSVHSGELARLPGAGINAAAGPGFVDDVLGAVFDWWSSGGGWYRGANNAPDSAISTEELLHRGYDRQEIAELRGGN